MTQSKPNVTEDTEIEYRRNSLCLDSEVHASFVWVLNCKFKCMTDFALIYILHNYKNN